MHHIMMFPWLAFGHMIPFFELSKRLAAKGVLVSYVSTPRNLHRLPPIPSPLQPKMQLLEIQTLPVDGLPDNCEATLDLQKEQVPLLKKAYDTLAEPFEHLLQSGPRPDFILVDFAPYWISLVAAKFGIRIAYFSVYTAATLAYLGPPAELKSVKRCAGPEVDRGGDPMRGMRNTHVPDASGVSSGQRLGKIRLAYFLRCLKRTRTRRAAPTPGNGFHLDPTEATRCRQFRLAATWFRQPYTEPGCRRSWLGAPTRNTCPSGNWGMPFPLRLGHSC